MLERFELSSDARLTSFGNEVLHAQVVDHFARAVVHTFRVAVASTGPERIERSWPTSWWDAFVVRWFPTFRRYFPRLFRVTYTRLVVEKRGLYPEIPFRAGERYTAIPFIAAHETREHR